MSNYFEQIIDGMVFELYFEELLKKENIEIIKYLNNLINISNTPDKEKLKIIKETFDKLNNPKHPLKNNLLNLDKIPEIKVIKE
jgi:hypothetical protein